MLCIGLAIHSSRDLLMRENKTAQMILGFSAAAIQPVGTLFILLNALLYKKTLFFYKAGLVVTLIIFWLYALISAADFPYYHQFGSHSE